MAREKKGHKFERGGTTPGEVEEKYKEEKAPARKRGGRIHGEKSEKRADRRARGGSIDMNPVSAAGKMTEPNFVSTKDVDRG